MKLVGSTTSPYVRRIRLLLADRPYEFVNLDIYDQDREELRRLNPAMKVPMLLDGDQPLFDSRVISRYLSTKLRLPALSWNQENQLTLIDAVNDSFVILLQGKRSGFDTDQDSLLFKLQRERVQATLEVLNEMVETGQFAEWNYPAICLYCLVDWADFREMTSFQGVEALLRFRDQNRSRSMITETDPRAA